MWDCEGSVYFLGKAEKSKDGKDIVYKLRTNSHLIRLPYEKDQQ